jgi:hypothetical protein
MKNKLFNMSKYFLCLLLIISTLTVTKVKGPSKDLIQTQGDGGGGLIWLIGTR